MLADLREKRELTIILVSHNLAVVAHLCSRIAVMTEGRIVEEATETQLRRGIVDTPYAQALLEASRGFRRRE